MAQVAFPTLHEPLEGKITLLDGDTHDILWLEKKMSLADATILFLEKETSKGKALTELLEQVSEVLNVAIHIKHKKVLVITDGEQEILRQLTGENEWRSNHQHSNWVRLHYLIEQEIHRARIEGLEATRVTHAPFVSPLHFDEGTSGNLSNAFILTMSEKALFGQIHRLILEEETLKPRYFFSAPPHAIIYRFPEHRSFWQRLIGQKQEKSPWYIGDDSFQSLVIG